MKRLLIALAVTGLASAVTPALAATASEPDATVPSSAVQPTAPKKLSGRPPVDADLEAAKLSGDLLDSVARHGKQPPGEHGQAVESEPPGTVRGEITRNEQQLRDDWFYSQRAYPHRTIPAGARLNALRQARQLPTVHDVERLPRGDNQPSTAADSGAGAVPTVNPPAGVSDAVWTSMGPHPISADGPSGSVYYNGVAPRSGRVTAIAVDPSNTAVAYIGGANGGVWKTTNTGTSWTPLTDKLASMAVGAIAIDPNATSTVYVGTGEGNDTGDSYYGAGLFKSTDGGSGWLKVGGDVFDNCHISDVLVQTGNSSVVLVAVSPTSGISGPGSCSGTAGIWRSTNAGTSFTRVRADTYGTSDLERNPANANVFFAGDWDSGFLISTDGGASWVASTTGFADIQYTGRVQIGSGANGQRLYALVAQWGGGLYGVYTSTNGGASWAPTTGQPTSSFCNLDIHSTGGQCNYDLAIAVNQTDSNVFYVAGIYLYRSADAGQSYGYTGNAPLNVTHQVHVDMHALAWVPGSLWLGSDGGVYRTTDAVNWSSLNNDLAITQIEPGTSGSYAEYNAGTQDNGTLQFTGNLGWLETNAGDGGPTATDPNNADVAYAEYIKLIVSKTTDGAVYNQVTPSNADGTAVYCLGDSGCLFYAPIAMDPSHPSTVYAGTDRVRRTTDGWASQPAAISGALGGYVSTIAPAPSSTSVVYAGTTTGGLHVTTDALAGTPTWTNTMGNGLPGRYVTEIVVDPTNSAHAYVGVSGYGSGHVFVTTNTGGTWTDVSGDLPNVPVNALAVDWRTGTPTLYAGSDVGAFVTSDGGASWQRYAGGLPNTSVLDLLVDTTANKVIAATHGRGAWVAPIGAATAAAPGNDDFSNAQLLAGRSAARTSDSNVHATKEAGEPNHTGDPGGASVWYSWTAPADGDVTIDTIGSNFDTMLAVYTGGAVDALTPVVSNDDAAAAGGPSKVTFPAVSGTAYRIAVDGWAGDTGTPSTGTVALHLSQPPPNDAFASAFTLSGTGDARTGDTNAGATKEAGEPAHDGNAGGASVWYSWTAPSSGNASIDTTGSDFDTTLGVYTGGSVDALTKVASNDDASTQGGPSKVSFAAVSGTTYRIAVDGYAGNNGIPATGSVNLHVGVAPPNDDFGSSAQLSGSTDSRSGDTNVNATKEAGEPNHAGNTGGASVWYSWTAPAAGTATVDTIGSGFDTVLGVYTGTPVDALTAVASDDDGGSAATHTSKASFTASAGTTYRIAVDGYAGNTAIPDTGAVTVNIAFVAAPTGTTGTTYDDTSIKVRLDGWRPVADGGATKNHYRVGGGTAKATLTFRGTRVTYAGRTGPDRGIVKVLVGTKSYGTVDLYSKTRGRKVLAIKGLTSRSHTITVRGTGRRNARSSGTSVTLDEFVLGTTHVDDIDPRVTLQNWHGVSTAAALHGSYRRSATDGAVTTMSFSGPSLTWLTALGPDQGQASVIIDGSAVGMVSNYAATRQWRFARVYDGLGSGQHTVQIKVLGTREQASTGKWVTVDGFVVG